jgi:hypothetical protein
MYYIYSLRSNGWWNGANYTSDLKEALKFPRTEAIVFAARRFDERGHGLLPVAIEDLNSIKDMKA